MFQVSLRENFYIVRTEWDGEKHHVGVGPRGRLLQNI